MAEFNSYCAAFCNEKFQIQNIVSCKLIFENPSGINYCTKWYQEPGPQTKENSLSSLSVMDNKLLPPAKTNSVDSTHAVFLCDSNGKYLNTKKMFSSNKNIEYFRCPTIAKARAIIHNDLSDSPQLLVIHTGTNALTLTTPTDEFISEVTSFITETATKFPKSKLIYSTFILRGDIPAATITRINEQLIAGLSHLPNVHLVNHDNLFAEEIDLLHDTKHIKRRRKAYLPQI